MYTRKKILLVDDEEAITYGFSRVFASPEVGVNLAHTADEAQKLITLNRYDAAVIDLRLSNSTDIEGFELINALKKSSPRCIIIVLTANSEDSIKQRAMRAGVDFFYVKPMEPEQIKEALRSNGIYATLEEECRR